MGKYDTLIQPVKKNELRAVKALIGTILALATVALLLSLTFVL